MARFFRGQAVASVPTRVGLCSATAPPQPYRQVAPLFSLARTARRVSPAAKHDARTNSSKKLSSSLARGDTSKAVAVVGATTDENLPVFKMMQEMAGQVLCCSSRD